MCLPPTAAPCTSGLVRRWSARRLHISPHQTAAPLLSWSSAQSCFAGSKSVNIIMLTDVNIMIFASYRRLLKEAVLRCEEHLDSGEGQDHLSATTALSSNGTDPARASKASSNCCCKPTILICPDTHSCVLPLKVIETHGPSPLLHLGKRTVNRQMMTKTTV